MFNQGLSLDQAPPISVPFRFFLTAPFFGILLGFVFFFFPIEQITNRFTHIAIGAVHLFTLGILAQIIFGAMQQMMPVLAGAVIKKPKLFATIVHGTLTLGTLFFAISFLFDKREFLIFGAISLAISFLLFFGVALNLLFRVKYLTSTVKAMRIFVVAGVLTASVGIVLSISHIILNIGLMHYIFVNIHILLGILGFAVILVMGVSFQVIPMFYVARDFPKFIQDKMPIFLSVAILIFVAFLLFGFDIYILKLAIAISLMVFSYYALNSLNNRKRPVFDVTLWYWKFSLYMFIISMLSWLFIPQERPFDLAILVGFGFLYSLLQGMVYKIIPFLSWFHLSSSGYFSIPTMREMINEDMIKLHFFIYVASVGFFLISSFLSNIFIYIGAILFILSNIIFLFNCLTAITKYNQISKTKPMQMSMPNK